MVGHRRGLAMSDIEEFIQDLQDLRALLVEEGRESELQSLDAWIELLHREVVGWVSR
jgi:hypothetical protein